MLKIAGFFFFMTEKAELILGIYRLLSFSKQRDTASASRLKFSHDDRNKDNDWIFNINEICISNKNLFSNLVIIYMYTSINKSHEEACVMGEITKVLNSNESLPIDENLL